MLASLQTSKERLNIALEVCQDELAHCIDYHTIAEIRDTIKNVDRKIYLLENEKEYAELMEDIKRTQDEKYALSRDYTNKLNEYDELIRKKQKMEG